MMEKCNCNPSKLERKYSTPTTIETRSRSPYHKNQLNVISKLKNVKIKFLIEFGAF